MTARLKIIGITLCVILGIPTLLYIFYILIGHYPTSPGYTGIVAQRIVDNDLPAEECSKIEMNPFTLIRYPTVESIRRGCIYLVANIRQDPTACELLLPGDYGWSCLGAASSDLDVCGVDFEREVSWNTGDRKNDADWHSLSFSECSSRKNLAGQAADCCYLLRLASEEDVNDCTRFEGRPDYKDLCLEKLALKKRDSNLCTAINSTNRKRKCELQAKYAH